MNNVIIHIFLQAVPTIGRCNNPLRPCPLVDLNKLCCANDTLQTALRNNNTCGTGFKQSDCLVGTFILLLNNVILYNSVANFIYQE